MAIVGTNVAKVEDIQTIETKLETQLIQIASRELGVSPDELVVRDILPVEDLGLANENWVIPTPTADAYNVYVDTTIADNKFIGIYGVGRKAGDEFTLIKFESGARTIDIWDASVTDFTQTTVKLANTPIIYRQNMPCRISVYATASATITPVLLGKVAEPKGKTISP